MSKFYFMNLEYFLHYYRYNWICLPFRSDSPLAILSVSTSRYQIVHFIIFICAEPSSKKNQEPSKLVSIYLFIFIRNYRIITTGIGNLIALKKVPSFSLKVWTCSIVCSLRFHDIYFLGVFVSQNRKWRIASWMGIYCSKTWKFSSRIHFYAKEKEEGWRRHM